MSQEEKHRILKKDPLKCRIDMLATKLKTDTHGLSYTL